MTYCFKCAHCGHRFSLQRSQDQFRAPAPCPKCSTIAERDFLAEQGTQFHRPGLWPQHSLAAAVHPDDRGAAMAAASKYGVPTDFDKDGRPVFTSRRHRKNYCEKVAALYDRDAGYGDPQRRDRPLREAS